MLTTNCSNNYGPYQFPEKLIPLVIHKALAGISRLPVYGDGQNDPRLAVRDRSLQQPSAACYKTASLRARLQHRRLERKRNLDVVDSRLCAICSTNCSPRADGKAKYEVSKSPYVKDRPGHDRRYAIDASKIERELGWKPAETFETGIRKTVQWYLDNQAWVANVTSGAYKNWVGKHYGA